MDEFLLYVICERNDNFNIFIDKIIGFFYSIFGEVRQGVANVVSDLREGKIVYNKEVWDLEKIPTLKDSVIKANYLELIREIQKRLSNFNGKSAEFIFSGKWKNPYSKNDTYLSPSVSITLEDATKENQFIVNGTFFQLNTWFSIYCKPLNENSELVKKGGKSIWNTTPSGLILPLQEKLVSNRKMVTSIMIDLIEKFSPEFSSISFSKVKFNKEENKLILLDPDLKKDKNLLPIFLYFAKKDGNVVYYDNSLVKEKLLEKKIKRGLEFNVDTNYFE